MPTRILKLFLAKDTVRKLVSSNVLTLTPNPKKKKNTHAHTHTHTIWVSPKSQIKCFPSGRVQQTVEQYSLNPKK